MHLDPHLVNIFLQNIPEILTIQTNPDAEQFEELLFKNAPSTN